MVNILVPTDLSELSKVAIHFAIKFANKSDADITLLNVINMIRPARASMRVRVKKLEREFTEAAVEDLNKLVEEVSVEVKTGRPIKIKIAKGETFNGTVKKEAGKLRSGLIIMSTKGASGLKKYVIGSNTASVIDTSNVPVLVVPELAKFKRFKNVVYATDLKHTAKEIKKLIPYLEKFDAVIHLIHVTSSLNQVSSIEKKIDDIVRKGGYKNIVVRVMVSKNIDEAIDQYVTTIKADLLTTFTHKHGFYDKLFNRSITRKIAFQSKIPLLAFRHR